MFYFITGEPNERQYSPSGEDCIEMVPNWNYQWNDKRCDKEQHFICKKAGQFSKYDIRAKLKF
jgi:hypothetical protein